jgi:hypothetical protein
VLASRHRNTMGLSGAGAEPAHAAQARLPGKDCFGMNPALSQLVPRWSVAADRSAVVLLPIAPPAPAAVPSTR